MPSVEAFRVEAFTACGTAGPCNEDAFFSGLRTFGVLDGAKPRNDVTVHGLSSSAFLAQFAKALFVSSELNPEELAFPVRDTLVRVNSEFGSIFPRVVPQAADLGKHGPAASVAALRFHENSYSWAQSGDCVLCEIDVSGELRQLPPMVPRSNEKSRLLLVRKGLEAGQSIEEVLISDEFMRLRNLDVENRNISHACFNGEATFPLLLNNGTRPTEGVRTIVILSDGMAWPTGDTEWSYAEAARRIEEMGIEPYFRDLARIYEEDAQMKSFVRFKRRDDATAVVLRSDR